MPKTSVTFHPFDSAMELAIQLADEIAGRLADALTKRNRASLVVSGGTTPNPFLTNFPGRKSTGRILSLPWPMNGGWKAPTRPAMNCWSEHCCFRMKPPLPGFWG